MSQKLPGAYVRLIQPSEHKEAAQVLTRAFVHDPATNWYGCVKEMVPDRNSKERHAVRTLKRLRYFHAALLKLTSLVGGLITVAVIPSDETDEDSRRKHRSEKIVGVTLWLKPGQTFDFGVGTLMKSGIHKVIYGWGIEGIKRIQVEFTPAVEHTLENSFKARGKDRLDSWHLLIIAVDPDYEGKGLCKLMMEDGFGRTTPKPVHLEATTSRSRDIYARFGFEVDEEHCFGKGKVDAHGLKARGEAATGYPEWVMTKVGPLPYDNTEWTY